MYKLTLPRLRRLAGAVTLVVGIWSLWTFVHNMIGGREIVGVNYRLLVRSFILPVPSLGATLWFLLSLASKIGMILDREIKRVPLSVVATAWYFVFGVLSLLTPQSAPDAALVNSTMSLGPVGMPALALLVYVWGLTDLLDALFAWLASKDLSARLPAF